MLQASLGNRACSTACSSSAASSRGNLKRPARLLTRVQVRDMAVIGCGGRQGALEEALCEAWDWLGSQALAGHSNM